MKNLLSLIVALSVLLTFAIPSFSGTDPCDGVGPDRILKHVPLPKFNIVGKTPREGACEVVIKVLSEEEVLPIYVFPDFVISGDMFKNKVHVTMETIGKVEQEAFRSVADEVVKATVFSYKPQGAKSYIFMVTDPECPYCERAKFQIKEFADKNNVEIKVLFYPLPAHQQSKSLAIKAVCSKMDYSSYLLNKYGDSQCKEGEQKVATALELLGKIGVTGTPTFISSTGKTVVGFDDAQIKDIL